MNPVVTEQALKTIPVHITDDRGNVDQASVPISKSANEEIKWFAYDNQAATIVFSSAQGTPFQTYSFHVPAGGSVSSGAIKNSVPEGAHYKYTVAGSKGGTDPEVIINR
jgi:hypothetical protein